MKCVYKKNVGGVRAGEEKIETKAYDDDVERAGRVVSNTADQSNAAEGLVCHRFF